MMIAELRRAAQGLAQLLTLAATCALVTPALAANYPLELVSPRAVGTSPSAGTPAISANNRIFWAYPGLEYNIRATVIGGAYPFTFSISNAPSGMTINARTGEVRWPNPTGSTASPRISVTDSENVTVSSPWTITVDPNRFIFLDATNGREFDAANPGTGTIANPFRRVRDLYSGSDYAAKTDNRHVNKIAYFRTGTYNIDGFIEDASGDNAGRMAVLEGNKPVAWVAYPGETPTIDGRCSALNPQIGSRPCNYGAHIAFYGNGNNTYIDGFRLFNMAVHAFRVAGSGNYQTFRRNRFSVNGPTIAGVNQGFIATMTGEPGFYMTIQDNVFENIEQGTCVKLYATKRILIEDNTCRNVSGNESEGFAVKGGEMERVTIRHNVISNVYQQGIGGNMHVLRNGEFLFNVITGAGRSAIDINQDGLAGPVYIYRNTFVGRVQVKNTDSADGPFRFYNNVIVNGDPGASNAAHIDFEGVSDPSRIISVDNLVGYTSANIVDANGALTPAFSQFIGSRGFQIGATGTPPSPPSNVIVD